MKLPAFILNFILTAFLAFSAISINSIEISSSGFSAGFNNVEAAENRLDKEAQDGFKTGRTVTMYKPDFAIEDKGDPILNLGLLIQKLIGGSAFLISVVVGAYMFVFQGLVKLVDFANPNKNHNAALVFISIVIGVFLMNQSSSIALIAIGETPSCTPDEYVRASCFNYGESGLTDAALEKIKALDSNGELVNQLANYAKMISSLIKSCGYALFIFWLVQIRKSANGSRDAMTAGVIFWGFFATVFLANNDAVVEIALDTIKKLGFSLWGI